MSKTRVEEPCDAYEYYSKYWTKCSAFVAGEDAVKSLDILPNVNSNILLPFSPTMSLEQYNFFKSEAELPGITSQFVAVIIGGLLRKPPVITYKKDIPEEAKDWVINDITNTNGSLVSFLNELLKEEMQTSRAWIYVDYPGIDEEIAVNMSKSEWDAVKPYVTVWPAATVINWQVKNINGVNQLSRVIVRGFVDEYETQESFHPTSIDTIWVHELIDGLYQVRTFTLASGTAKGKSTDSIFVLTKLDEPKMHGERMTMIPAWPANGSVDCVVPYINAFVDKEAALYNVMSRRNHLLYGAATYTPWIASDMQPQAFEKIVNQGLGTWILLNKEDRIGTLAPPVEALKDLDTAISSKLEELAKLGMRFLAPESAQSGVALTIRNATQTATLGIINTNVSEVLTNVVVHLLNRRFDLRLTPTDVTFSLSPDFDPVSIGVEFLRIATEWYQASLLPRSEWIRLLKANEMLSPEYVDEEAIQEINADELTQPTSNQQEDGISTADKLKQELKKLNASQSKS
jgi:hypothetical protein